MLNLSYSFLAGVIFYLLNSCFPSFLQRRKALKILETKFVNLYSKINKLIAIEKLQGNCNKENSKININDCEFANHGSNDNTRIFVKEHIRIDTKKWRENNTYSWVDPFMDKVKSAEKIKELAQNILHDPISKKLDENLLETLDSVINSKTIDQIIRNKEPIQLTNGETIKFFAQIGKEPLFEFIKLEQKLREFSFPHHEHRFTKMSKEEEKEYKEFIARHENWTVQNPQDVMVYRGNKRIQ